MPRSFLTRFPALVLAITVATASVGITAAQDATPETGVQSSVLIDRVITGQPVGHCRVSVERYTFAPGPAIFTQGAYDGPAIFVVTAGRIAFATPDETQTLEVGGVFVQTPEQDFTMQNAGDEEAQVVNLLLVPSALENYSFDPLAIRFDDPLDYSIEDMPSGAVRAVLEQWVLHPGDEAPAYITGQFDWFGVVDGRIALSLEGERLPYRWVSGDERDFAALQTLPIIYPDTVVSIANPGDLPALVYHLTITPEDAAPEASPGS